LSWDEEDLHQGGRPEVDHEEDHLVEGQHEVDPEADLEGELQQREVAGHMTVVMEYRAVRILPLEEHKGWTGAEPFDEEEVPCFLEVLPVQAERSEMERNGWTVELP
jgi:hypothetical protein